MKKYIVGIVVFTLAIFAVLPRQTTKTEIPMISMYDTPAFRKSFFDAARVYGRAGCGDVLLAEQTAQASSKTGLPANVIAAVIGVESHCDNLAVSRSGAIGLLQVMPKLWSQKYDFQKINLLNPQESLQVGTAILSDNVKQYGLREGLRHYNGSGPDAEAYALRVTGLADMK